MSDIVNKLSETQEQISMSPESSTTSKELLDEFVHAKEIFLKENITDNSITELIDQEYKNLPLDKKLKKLLNYIIIEFWQNITKHGVEHPEQLKNPVSKISLRAGINELYLETENYVEKDEILKAPNTSVKDFTDNIKEVGNMWYKELQAEYTKVLTKEDMTYNLDPEVSRRKWAGLGFINVARKIKKMYNNIWQVFTPIVEKVNDYIYKFRLITKIPFPKLQ